MKTTITFMAETYDVLKTYKNHLIVSSQDQGIIHVINVEASTCFVIGLDDRKLSGHRTFDESLNTVETAISYIDGHGANLELAEIWYCKGSGTIRTKSNCMIATFRSGIWVIDFDSAIRKTTLLAVASALYDLSRDRFSPDGTKLVEAAKTQLV
jgi:hypothetical protein